MMKMTRHILPLLVLVATLLWTTQAMAKTIKVVTSTPDLAALTVAVGGERVKVTSLARHTEDPHYVDAKPSHVIKLNKADLLLVNGLELEVGWLPGLITQARNEAILPGASGSGVSGYLDASTVVELMQVPTQAIDRSQGDVHPGGNPHYLHDPRRALVVADAITTRLIKLDPKGKEAYAKNLKTFKKDLNEAMEGIDKKFSTLSSDKKKVVTYHASTIYISDWLGLTEVIQVEPKPGIAPTPKHVARVLKAMRSHTARVIFQESYYPRKTSNKLAELAKGEVVVIAGGTDISDGETYIARTKAMADAIYAALSR